MDGVQLAATSVGIIATLSGMGGAFLSLYMRAALSKTSERVTRLEALREEDVKRLDRIDNKLDEILRLVRQN
jgi:hypothetical protein